MSVITEGNTSKDATVLHLDTPGLGSHVTHGMTTGGQIPIEKHYRSLAYLQFKHPNILHTSDELFQIF